MKKKKEEEVLITSQLLCGFQETPHLGGPQSKLGMGAIPGHGGDGVANGVGALHFDGVVREHVNLSQHAVLTGRVQAIFVKAQTVYRTLQQKGAGVATVGRVHCKGWMVLDL